jgi:N6-L-threonylcarbamoyladenine synthase
MMLLVRPLIRLQKSSAWDTQGARLLTSFPNKEIQNEYASHGHSLTRPIAAGFQEAVVDVLVQKAISAAKAKACQHLALVGGVASNSRLRKLMTEAAKRAGINIHIPSLELCTDNAAMIATMGYHQFTGGKNASPPAPLEPEQWRAGLDLDVYSKTNYSGRLGVVR